jgi:hypothetical protein
VVKRAIHRFDHSNDLDAEVCVGSRLAAGADRIGEVS